MASWHAWLQFLRPPPKQHLPSLSQTATCPSPGGPPRYLPKAILMNASPSPFVALSYHLRRRTTDIFKCYIVIKERRRKKKTQGKPGLVADLGRPFSLLHYLSLGILVYWDCTSTEISARTRGAHISMRHWHDWPAPTFGRSCAWYCSRVFVAFYDAARVSLSSLSLCLHKDCRVRYL